MQKTTFLGGAAMALMAATSANAQSGYVGLSYQSADIGASSDIDSTALTGAVLLGEHFQVNGRFASIDGGSLDDWAVDGFVFNRGEGGAIGGFIGFEAVEAAGGSFDAWEVGGFGQAYAGRTNWTAQLGYTDTEGGDVTLLHLDGEARHFVGDNFSIQANLGFGRVDFGDEENYWSGGLGAEAQFASAPVSLYGGWQHVEFQDGGDGIDTLGLGVRWNFGGGALMDRSRSGAGFQNTTPNGLELELGGGFVPR